MQIITLSIFADHLVADAYSFPLTHGCYSFLEFQVEDLIKSVDLIN